MKATITILVLAVLLSLSFEGKNPYPKLPKSIRHKYALVPAGEVTLGNSKIKLNQPFYISKTEISNAKYQEFLKDLRASGKEDLFKLARVDSSGWLKAGSYDSPPSFI